MVLALLLRLARQGSGLPHGCFHLALGGNFVRHEGERQTVALFRFGRDPDAVHAGHHHVAGLEIAQAAAECFGISDIRACHDDHRVHALVLHFDEFAADANEVRWLLVE